MHYGLYFSISLLLRAVKLSGDIFIMKDKILVFCKNILARIVKNETQFFWSGMVIVALFNVALFELSFKLSNAAEKNDFYIAMTKSPEVLEVQAPVSEPPQEVRGIYMSAYVAGDKIRREKLFKLIDDTELNAVVIDIKDSTGKVFFDAQSELIRSYDTVDVRIADIDPLLEDLHKRGMWVIARQVVFQDPELADARPDLAVHSKRTGKSWRDNGGRRWMDTASKDVWNYNMILAREAASRGFDEIQFDYIRFPSDGNISDMSFPVWDGKTPKYDVLRSFFEYIDKNLSPLGVKTSVDLFGMTFNRVDKPTDDLGIGQRVVDAVPYIDYISPMVYPSHYPPTFEGYANPAAHPYAIVDIALKDAASAFINSRAKVRPWLQDFDMGADYNAAMIQAQIKASRDNGASGWLLWNPSNIYTQAALDKDVK